MMRELLGFYFCFFLFVCPSLGFASNEPDVIAQIFEKKSDAVVLIAVGSPQGDRLGSGFFISRDGKVVTNYHLINGAHKIAVKLKNGSAFIPIKIINLDPAKDIAVIQINASSPTYFVMGDSNAVIVGQRVLTIGNPRGLENTVSDGLISSIRLDNFGMKIFQISVPLSNGSSGGPLIDFKGEVMGITTASMSGGENLNFAVPINYVRILLKKPFDASRMQLEPWQIEQHRSEGFSNHPSEATHDYVVQKGDSLYSIAKRFRTSVKALIRINHLKDTKIIIGQRLILP
jgi:S1-C subfamily serine protease